LFEQAPSSGSFEEGMPSNCDLHDDALYVVRHNPEAFYTRIRASCARDDVPLGTPRSGRFLTELEAGSLPAFSFVTPNVCDDMHSCAVSRGDSWLARWVQIIAASRSYREGQVVLFLTWDENDGSTGNHVPLIVVSPFTTPGTRSNGSFTHYSLLRTTEQLLGLHHYLGHAASASSMRVAFGL
jgi:phospholipase C